MASSTFGKCLLILCFTVFELYVHEPFLAVSTIGKCLLMEKTEALPCVDYLCMNLFLQHRLFASTYFWEKLRICYPQNICA